MSKLFGKDETQHDKHDEKVAKETQKAQDYATKVHDKEKEDAASKVAKKDLDVVVKGKPAKVGVVQSEHEARKTAAELKKRRAGVPKILVKATEQGYYDHVLRHQGDVFSIHKDEFSERWMEAADPKEVAKDREAEAESEENKVARPTKSDDTVI